MDKQDLRTRIEEVIQTWASGATELEKEILADDIAKLIKQQVKEHTAAVNKLGYMTMAMYAIAEYRGIADTKAAIDMRNMADKAVQKYGYEEFKLEQQRIQDAAAQARARLTDKDGWTCMVPPCVIELIEAVEAVRA